jgi:hypothetical protein
MVARKVDEMGFDSVASLELSSAAETVGLTASFAVAWKAAEKAREWVASTACSPAAAWVALRAVASAVSMVERKAAWTDPQKVASMG